MKIGSLLISVPKRPHRQTPGNRANKNRNISYQHLGITAKAVLWGGGDALKIHFRDKKKHRDATK